MTQARAGMSEARMENMENLSIVQTQGSVAGRLMRKGWLDWPKIAAGLGESSIAAEIRQLVTRMMRALLRCLRGQFKRGKSTLLDAL